ncbi:MAG: PTS sugar transporter subunit IIA [Elusimicrobiota bacterium]|nr:PTS sugar transporter subunit IIA [Elusimicrobiota bacterium]
MKIFDFLHPKAIILELQSRDKRGVIAELIELLAKEKKVKDVQKAINAVIEREKLGSTGVGQGVAIPHGRTDTVSDLVAAFGISKEGIEFNSLDGEPVYLVFLLLSPVDSAGQHLRALAKVSRLFKDKFFRQALRDAKTVEEVHRIIQQEDEY